MYICVCRTMRNGSTKSEFTRRTIYGETECGNTRSKANFGNDKRISPMKDQDKMKTGLRKAIRTDLEIAPAVLSSSITTAGATKKSNDDRAKVRTGNSHERIGLSYKISCATNMRSIIIVYT